MVFSTKLYDASFGNAKGGRTNPPPPTPAKVAKHRLRARVKSRDLLCACAVDIWLYLQYYWADLAQTCSLGPLAMSRILSLRLIHAMYAPTSLDNRHTTTSTRHTVAITVEVIMTWFKILLKGRGEDQDNWKWWETRTVSAAAATGATHIYSLLKDISKEFTGP